MPFPRERRLFQRKKEPTFMADKKPATKTEILNNIAESTGLARKDVAGVMEALSEEIKKGVSKRGPGVFTIPGLCKIVVQRKPATKATTRANPFKPGEMMEVAAKPARNVVKVRPLKNLKDMVA
jgi:nucleoid DNA-binding protein